MDGRHDVPAPQHDQTRGSASRLVILSTATGLSVLSDSVFALALAWTLTTRGDLTLLTAMLVASAIARLGLMPLGGALADRHSKVYLLRLSAAGRILGVCGVAAALHHGSDPGAIASMVILGAASAAHYPADRAIVTEIVLDDELDRANGILQSVMNLGNVLGPVLGGAVLVWVGGAPTVVVAGCLYAAALLTLLFLRSLVPPATDHDTRPGLFTTTLAGARYALADRSLIALLAVIAVMNLGFVGPFAIALPAHVHDTLGGSPTTLAWLQAGFTAGSIGGALLVATIWAQPGRAALPVAVIITATTLLVVAVSPNRWLAVAALAVGGVASGIANVVLITAVQKRTDKAFMARVMSLVMLLSMGLAPVSQALTGALLVTQRPATVIAGGAVLTLLGGLVSIPIAVRALAPAAGVRAQ